MMNIILRTLITFFAIYGFAALCKELVDMIFLPKNPYDDLVIVVKVLNSEKSLEGTVRMILWKCLSISHGSFMPNILIVDMGSADSTAQIAKKLCDDYSFIRYTNYENYLKAKTKE